MTAYCVRYKGFFKEVRVTTHSSAELAKACGDDTGGPEWSALVVSSEVDIDLGGPGLVALYNSMFPEPANHVKKFESRGIGKKRVFEVLERIYQYQPHEEAQAAPTRVDTQAAKPEGAPSGPPLEQEIEAIMAGKAAKKAAKAAKKTKPKKDPADRKPRGVGKAAGKVSEFRPIREGTDRQKVLKLMNGQNTAAQISQELGFGEKGEKKVGTIVFCMSRDNGIGYEFGGKGQIKALFPGEKTYKDAVKKPAAE